MVSIKINETQKIELQSILNTSLAIDIGTEFTKTSAGIIFRSTVRKVNKHPEPRPAKINVIYNGNLYVVGDTYGDEILSSNNCSCEEYKICLLTAIALSTKKDINLENDIKVRLAVGLPAEYHDLLHNELTNAICKMSSETLTIQNTYCIGKVWCYPTIIEKWETCKIDILEHHIFMNGATLCNEYKKQFNYPLLLLDLGSITLNVSLWQCNHDKIEICKTRTYEHLGFIDIMHRFATLINCTKGSGGRYDELDVIEFLEGDIQPLDKSVFEQIKNNILNPYIYILSSLFKDFDIDNCKEICLLGAPATVCFNYFVAKYPHTNIKLLEDTNPQFANATLFNKRYKELLTLEFMKNLE